MSENIIKNPKNSVITWKICRFLWWDYLWRIMGEKKGMINYDCLKHKKWILWKHCSFSLVNDLDGVMFLYIYGRVNEK